MQCEQSEQVNDHNGDRVCQIQFEWNNRRRNWITHVGFDLRRYLSTFEVGVGAELSHLTLLMEVKMGGLVACSDKKIYIAYRIYWDCKGQLFRSDATVVDHHSGLTF